MVWRKPTGGVSADNDVYGRWINSYLGVLASVFNLRYSRLLNVGLVSLPDLNCQWLAERSGIELLVLLGR